MRTALVIGGADCVWRDVSAALDLGEFAGVVACNDVIAEWKGKLDAACSLHASKLPGWLRARSNKCLPEPGRAFVSTASDRHYGAEAVNYRLPGQIVSGSSGLFAVKIALIDLGFDRAVCCGIPMSDEPHFFDTKGWVGADRHWPGWGQAIPFLADRTRSMSGRTKDLLGAPTPAWLLGQ
jgi:hypothetical protein